MRDRAWNPYAPMSPPRLVFVCKTLTKEFNLYLDGNSKSGTSGDIQSWRLQPRFHINVLVSIMFILNGLNRKS